MKEMKRYRIFDTKTQKYLYLGFNNKTNWGVFPKDALESVQSKIEDLESDLEEQVELSGYKFD